MKYKKTILCVIILCAIAGIFYMKQKHDEQMAECRYCTLTDVQIEGTIQDISIPMDQPLDIEKLIWEVYATKDGIRLEDRTAADCLALLFQHVTYKVDVEDTDIVVYKDHQLVPKQIGQTSAVIKVTIDMQEDLKCGPPPSFEDTIRIEIK